MKSPSMLTMIPIEPPGPVSSWPIGPALAPPEVSKKKQRMVFWAFFSEIRRNLAKPQNDQFVFADLSEMPEKNNGNAQSTSQKKHHLFTLTPSWRGSFARTCKLLAAPDLCRLTLTCHHLPLSFHKFPSLSITRSRRFSRSFSLA